LDYREDFKIKNWRKPTPAPLLTLPQKLLVEMNMTHRQIFGLWGVFFTTCWSDVCPFRQIMLFS